MAFFDILVILLIGALVVSRFMGFKLPTDTRDKAARKAEYDNLFKRRRSAHDVLREQHAMPAEDEATEAEPTPLPKRRKLEPKDVAHLGGLEQIKALEPGFDAEEFLEGAVAAHGYFYECYNSRDQEGIINLCGPQLEEQILAEWESDPAEQVPEGGPQAEIATARLHGRTAIVEVLFKARLKRGKAAAKLEETVWVFGRAIGSTDPNWELQEIRPNS